jgi:mRNA interferase MazF
MKIRKFYLYYADLNPQMGTEPGKIRPVVVVQTDLLNDIHPSTIICPLTTNVHQKANILRVHVAKGSSGFSEDSDILIDQIRAIDNRRFKNQIGELSREEKKKLLKNLEILILE